MVERADIHPALPLRPPVVKIFAVVGIVGGDLGGIVGGLVRRLPGIALVVEVPRRMEDDLAAPAGKKSGKGLRIDRQSGRQEGVPVPFMEKGGDRPGRIRRQPLDVFPGFDIEGRDRALRRHTADGADNAAGRPDHLLVFLLNGAAQIPDLTDGEQGENHERNDLDEDKDDDQLATDAQANALLPDSCCLSSLFSHLADLDPSMLA